LYKSDYSIFKHHRSLCSDISIQTFIYSVFYTKYFTLNLVVPNLIIFWIFNRYIKYVTFKLIKIESDFMYWVGIIISLEYKSEIGLHIFFTNSFKLVTPEYPREYLIPALQSYLYIFYNKYGTICLPVTYLYNNM